MAGFGDVAEFFKSSKFSDVTIKFGKYQLNVHRLILVQKSDYFKAMFNSKFCEAHSGTIEVKNDEPFAFKGLIAYCYGLHFDGSRSFTKDGVQIVMNAQHSTTHGYVIYQVSLYVVAQKYLVPSLCAEISDAFPVMLSKLLDEDSNVTKDLVKVILHIYVTCESEAMELRSPIIELLVKRAPEWKDFAEFKQLMLDVPQLALDVVTELAGTVKVASPGKRAIVGAAGGTRSKKSRTSYAGPGGY